MHESPGSLMLMNLVAIHQQCYWRSLNINSLFYKEMATIATLLMMASSLIHHYLSWAFQQKEKDFTWATTFTVRWGNFAVHVCRSYERGLILFYNTTLQYLCMSINCNWPCNRHFWYYKSVFVKIYKCTLWFQWYQHLCCIL